MDSSIREKMRRICTDKINQKGEGVQVSFYAFFANQNDDPDMLMSVARWWIEENQLNHFEKATKIRGMLRNAHGISSEPTMLAFNHLTLTVNDLEASLAFYCGLLGFKGEVKWRTGAYLLYQDFWLCLSFGEAKPSQDYSHFAISATTETMKMLRQNKAFDGTKQWKENISEGDSLYLLDPDGHKLELHNGDLKSRLAALKKYPYDELVWLS